MSRTTKIVKLLLVAIAAFTGLAGVAAAVAVKQVPAGHRLEVEGTVYDDGLVIAPLWVDARLLPPADPPQIEVPKPAAGDDPRPALGARLDDARASLKAAEEKAVEHARVVGSDFAEAEQAHARSLAEVETEFEGRIAALEAEAEQFPERRAAEAEAKAVVMLAEGRSAVASAEARRSELLGAALAGEAGRYAVAIEAARNFELGDIHLPNPPPDFLQTMGSMDAWRRFFLGRPTR